MAFAASSEDWAGYVTALVGGSNEMIAYNDAQTGCHRYACYEGDRLAGAVFLAPEPVAVSRDWAIAQLGAPNLARRQRSSVVAGRPGKGGIERGATICACFGVGANEIAAAVGRGCKTCRPSAKRCTPAPTAAPAALKFATSSTRNSRPRP